VRGAGRVQGGWGGDAWKEGVVFKTKSPILLMMLFFLCDSASAETCVITGVKVQIAFC
jgi:hypothetical protein